MYVFIVYNYLNNVYIYISRNSCQTHINDEPPQKSTHRFSMPDKVNVKALRAGYVHLQVLPAVNAMGYHHLLGEGVVVVSGKLRQCHFLS